MLPSQLEWEKWYGRSGIETWESDTRNEKYTGVRLTKEGHRQATK